MLFSEIGEPWRELPNWAQFLIKVGLKWPIDDAATRRIGLISTPCETVAAELVALGAMSQRLRRQNANDLTMHWERIRRKALEGDTSSVLIKVGERGKFILAGFYNSELIMVKEQLPASKAGTNLKRAITEKSCLDWRFEDEPLVRVSSGARLSQLKIYAAMNDDAAVYEKNLDQSDSAICLVGRSVGETGTREAAKTFKLKMEEAEAGLDELLSIRGWSGSEVSRVSFFNPRTKGLDRRPRPPELVVADGDKPFQTALAQQQFKESDVLGCIDRSIDHERLVDVAQKMSSLNQWYREDTMLSQTLLPLPRGVSMTLLVRR